MKATADIHVKITDSISQEIESAVELTLSQPKAHEIHVHEFRKKIKRIRAILRLIRSSMNESVFYNLDNKLNLACNSLSKQRDATVNLRSLLNLDSISIEKLPREIQFNALTELKNQYKWTYHNTEGILTRKLEGVLFQLHEFRSTLQSIALANETPDQLFSALIKSYSKAGRLYYDSCFSLEKEVIHKWRKYNKYLLLQLKYFPLEIHPQDKIMNQLHVLTEILGTDHDYAELEDNLSRNLIFRAEELQTLHRIIDNLRLKLQKKAFDIGKKIYSKPIDIFSTELSAV